jgi:hypothetical protein
MSAGHSLRRQNYSFMSFAPPITDSSSTHIPSVMHRMRIVIAVATAIALDLATFASISMLITGR